MGYADTIRAASGVSMDGVAGLIEGTFVPRNALSHGGARSTTAVTTWETIPNTGVTVTLPSYCYVQQSFSLSVSHNVAFTLMAFTGARDSASNRPGNEIYCKPTTSDTGGLVVPVSFTCLWKLAPGTYTFHIAWWNSAGSTAYTNITTNVIEIRRENII